VRIEQADTHYIAVTCPAAVGDRLVKEGLLDDEPDFGDDD
jgi:hypothetical protein